MHQQGVMNYAPTGCSIADVRCEHSSSRPESRTRLPILIVKDHQHGKAHSMSREQPLPQGWVWTTLGEITQINPGIDILSMSDTTSVSFIPMAAVEAGSGYIDTSTV